MLDKILEDHAGRVSVIHYHTWWPSRTDPMYLYNTVENAARVNYYGADYTPHAWFDGDVDGEYLSSTWDALATAEESVSSPIQINLNIHHDHASNTGTIEAVVSATEEITNTNLHARFAIIESHVDGAGGFTEFNEAMRDMLPNATGLPISISKGEVVTANTKYTLDMDAYDWDNLDLVAFVQSDKGHRVLQAAMKPFPGPHCALSPTGDLQVSKGGTLNLAALVTNHTGRTVSGNLWLTIAQQGGAETLIDAGMLNRPNPLSGSVSAWDEQSVPLEMSVPMAGMPPGLYSIKGYIGKYPNQKVEFSFFDFEVQR